MTITTTTTTAAVAGPPVPRMAKTMRWWHVFLMLGLANPGFYLAGIAFSVVALGPTWAIGLWVASAALGAVQAYVYSETAAMFPDKPGGIAIYAREGWRSRCSLAGPLAMVGYWLTWTTVLAVFGGVIGLLVVHEFFAGSPVATWTWTLPGVGWALTAPRLIGLAAMVAAFAVNRHGQRTTLRVGSVAAALIAVPLVVIAVGAFVTGDVANHPVTGDNMAATLRFYGWPVGPWGKLVLVMAWLYVIGYNTYGAGCTATFAPEFRRTGDDTRKAILAVGGLNLALGLLLPLAIVGTVGAEALAKDTTGVVFLSDVLHAIAGAAAGKALVGVLCGGLFLLMVTATMSSGRLLYAPAEQGMTLQWLGRLNRYGVPARAMAVGLVFNAWLLFQFPAVFFILAVGNLGFMLTHVLALSGFLLLRRDRPHWPRPIRLGPAWPVVAAVACLANLSFTVFGLIGLAMTGYAFDAGMTNPTAWMGRIVVVGVATVAVAAVSYVAAQRRQGRPLRLTDPSDELPSAEALAGAGGV